MSIKLIELVALTGQHITLYETLAEHLSREQTALLEMDLEALQQAVKAKETTALKIKLMVPAVADAIADAAEELGLPREPRPTLAEIGARAPAPYGTRLARAGLALARLKRGIARHNEDNHSFVETAMEMINGSIAVITGAVTAKPRQGYSAKGRQTRSPDCPPVRLSREV